MVGLMNNILETRNLLTLKPLTLRKKCPNTECKHCQIGSEISGFELFDERTQGMYLIYLLEYLNRSAVFTRKTFGVIPPSYFSIITCQILKSIFRFYQ